MFHQGKGSSLFPHTCHLEHMYGSDICAFHVELFKMWPEILFIEKRNIKILRHCTVTVGTSRSYIYVVYVSAAAFFLKRSSEFFVSGSHLMIDKRILLDWQSVAALPYNTLLSNELLKPVISLVFISFLIKIVSAHEIK